MHQQLTAGITALTAVILAVITAACGTVVTSGTVISKRSVPAHLASKGDMITWDDQSWQVEVQAANGGKMWFTVSRSEFRDVKNGQEWSVPS
jgi:hypothetical protein